MDPLNIGYIRTDVPNANQQSVITLNSKELLGLQQHQALGLPANVPEELH